MLDRDVAQMRLLRRLISHFTTEFGMDPDEITLSSLLATLDYFDRNPIRFKEIFRDSI